MTIDVRDVVHSVTQHKNPMALLVNRMDDDWSGDYPEEMFEFGSQFMYMQGYDTYLDLNSLMVLLWKMDQRIKELENK